MRTSENSVMAKFAALLASTAGCLQVTCWVASDMRR
jgi:hypothetical protein